MIEAAVMTKRKARKASPQARAAQTRSRKPVNLPQWDHGAKGPANRIGLCEEAATEIDPDTGKETRNPNRVTRMRRRPWIETYLLQGKLTLSQVAIARELRDAAEGARNADPLAALRGQIDKDSRAPDPQGAAYDARRKFHRMWAMVPRYARPAIEAVVIEDRPAGGLAGRGRSSERHMQRLSQGLDELRAAWARS